MSSFLQILEQKFYRTVGIVNYAYALIQRPQHNETKENFFKEFSNLNSSKKNYSQ